MARLSLLPGDVLLRRDPGPWFAVRRPAAGEVAERTYQVTFSASGDPELTNPREIGDGGAALMAADGWAETGPEADVSPTASLLPFPWPTFPAAPDPPPAEDPPADPPSGGG